MEEYALSDTADSWYIVNSLFTTIKIIKYIYPSIQYFDEWLVKSVGKLYVVLIRMTNSWYFPSRFPKMTVSSSQIKQDVYYKSTFWVNVEFKEFVAKCIISILNSQVICYRNIKVFFQSSIRYASISDIV